MMTPPTAPMPRIGANTLVIIAGGKLSSIPIVRPISHPEHGMSIPSQRHQGGYALAKIVLAFDFQEK
jgi:hypothetical protein